MGHGHCQECGRRVRGQHPLLISKAFEVGTVHFGPRLLAFAAFQKMICGVSYDKNPQGQGDQPAVRWRCCTVRSKWLTSLCRSPSHPAQYVSGMPSAVILLSISHPIRCSTRCLANVRARILGPDGRFVTIDRVLHHASLGAA